MADQAPLSISFDWAPLEAMSGTSPGAISDAIPQVMHSQDAQDTQEEAATMNSNDAVFPFLRLPVELRVVVLSQLDDLKSLKSAILSGRPLNEAFKMATSFILTGLLANYLGSQGDFVPEAFAAFDSLRLRLQDTPGDFVARHFKSRNKTSFSATPATIRALIQSDASFRKAEEKFMQIYFVAINAKEQSPGPQPGFRRNQPVSYVTPTITLSERARLRRAIYRLDVFYSVIHCDRWSVEDREQCLQELFACFNQWENEQVVCLQEARWHVHMMRLLVHYDESMPMPVWTGGLTQDLQRLFTPNHGERAAPCNFLPIGREILRRSACPVMDASGSQFVIKPPFCYDPDPGPAIAWEWAHLANTCSQDMVTLARTCGCSLWDQKRVKSIITMLEAKSGVRQGT